MPFQGNDGRRAAHGRDRKHSERFTQPLSSTDRTRTFYHGHSYTGNPLAATAAVASLKVFESEPVFERIQAIAQIHAERLAAIQKHPAVGNVRAIGTVAAIELHADDAGYFSRLRPKLYKYFLEAGVLLRPLGNIIYVLPPYVISRMISTMFMIGSQIL